MIVIQNDIQACERSMEELRHRFQQNLHRAGLNQLDLEDLIRNVLAIGQKLLNEPARFRKLGLPTSELEEAENEWSSRMHAAEKLAESTLSVITEFGRIENGCIGDTAELKKMIKHFGAINVFSMEDVREARRDIREGRVTPLSAIKDAL